ncbi:low molecular weight protein-tyrosine-phosphatase [Propionibacteriaceae bacterium Y1923]
MTSEQARPFRILAVCTGNICRSPAAELLLQRALGPSVHVTSAGTGALVGEPIDPAMATLLHQDGLDTAEFSAHQLTAAMIRDADLVLPMTRHHRAAIVELVPAAVRRTFTLLEFAHVLQSLPEHSGQALQTPDERLRALLPAATASRSSTGRDLDEWDVPDPYRQSDKAFQQAFSLVRTATEGITRTLRRVNER